MKDVNQTKKKKGHRGIEKGKKLNCISNNIKSECRAFENNAQKRKSNRVIYGRATEIAITFHRHNCYGVYLYCSQSALLSST